MIHTNSACVSLLASPTETVPITTGALIMTDNRYEKANTFYIQMVFMLAK